MFPCVWLHFKKFSGKYFLVFGKEEGKHKSRKTQATTQKKIMRSRLREIAINVAILHRRDRDQLRDLATARSRAVDRDLRSRSEVRARDRDLATARDRDLREIAPPGARTGDRRRLEID